MSYSARTPRAASPRRRPRAAAVLAALMIGAAATAGAAGCSSEGSTTQCSVDACTVTFDRTVKDPSASILGIEVKLKSVDGANVVLTVGGHEVTAPVNQPTQAGDFQVTVEKITDAEIVVKIARGGGGG